MKADDNNPAGLSTMNPMRNPRYRATVRAISDRYRKLKGRPPVPDFEKAWEEIHPAAVGTSEAQAPGLPGGEPTG